MTEITKIPRDNRKWGLYPRSIVSDIFVFCVFLIILDGFAMLLGKVFGFFVFFCFLMGFAVFLHGGPSRPALGIIHAFDI